MKPNVLISIIKEVKVRIANGGTEDALKYLTQEGYLNWCAGKEIELSNIKDGYKTYPYTG